MYKRINHYKFYESGKTIYRNPVIKSVLDYFFLPKLSFPNRNAETFFQHELSLYVLLLTVNFYEQFLKLNFQGNNLNLSLKITYKDEITDIKDSV